MDRKAHLKAEPSDSLFCKMINEFAREAREGVGEDEFSKEALSLFFASDRMHSLCKKDGVISLCNAGDIVVQDRYFFSSLAYQDTPYAHLVNSIFPLPHLLIYLDLPPVLALQRLKKRGGAASPFEKSTFLNKAKQRYDELFLSLSKLAAASYGLDASGAAGGAGWGVGMAEVDPPSGEVPCGACPAARSGFHFLKVDASKSEKEVFEFITSFITKKALFV